MDSTQYPEYPKSVEGGEQNHEKTPVLKKVKEKVKKVKDKLSKKRHGHGDEEHDPQNDHRDDDVSEEEEGYEDDEERGTDPEVHAAVRESDESDSGRNLVIGRDESLGPEKVSLGDAIAMTGDEEATTVPKARDHSQLLYPSILETGTGERRMMIRDRDDHIDPEKLSLRAIVGSVDEDPAAPKNTPTGEPPTATFWNKHSQFPTTRGEEVGESRLLSSFQTMSVSDNLNPEGQREISNSPLTGTHDQFSPDKQPNPKQGETKEQHKTPTYTDKITSTATAAKDAAISAAVGSAEYGKKISCAVYEKVSELKSGQHPENKPYQSVQPADKGVADKGVSVKEYIAEKLRPGDEDRALSEVITGTIQKKKEDVKGSSEQESGGGGRGMVDKIKGAVSSWLGVGSVPEKASSHVSSPQTDTKVEGKETAAPFPLFTSDTGNSQDG